MRLAPTAPIAARGLCTRPRLRAHQPHRHSPHHHRLHPLLRRRHRPLPSAAFSAAAALSSSAATAISSSAATLPTATFSAAAALSSSAATAISYSAAALAGHVANHEPAVGSTASSPAAGRASQMGWATTKTTSGARLGRSSRCMRRRPTFHTEAGWDYITIGSTRFSGMVTGPANVYMAAYEHDDLVLGPLCDAARLDDLRHHHPCG